MLQFQRQGYESQDGQVDNNMQQLIAPLLQQYQYAPPLALPQYAVPQYAAAPAQQYLGPPPQAPALQYHYAASAPPHNVAAQQAPALQYHYAGAPAHHAPPPGATQQAPALQYYYAAAPAHHAPPPGATQQALSAAVPPRRSPSTASVRSNPGTVCATAGCNPEAVPAPL